MIYAYRRNILYLFDVPVWRSSIQILIRFLFRCMCRALGLPTSDLTYDDCKLMNSARLMNLPHADDIIEIAKLRQTIG